MARHARTAMATPLRSPVMAVMSLLLVLASATGLGVALARQPVDGSRRGTPHAAAADGRVTDWVDVLGKLDRARSRAFAASDEMLLTRVYTHGSRALTADRRLMRRYSQRGLRIGRLRMQVVDVRLLSARPSQAVLWVRDRITAGAVVDANGRTTPLPRDQWSNHEITVVEAGRGWRIASLRPG